ncbi:tryptophan synthase subunit alpha, partial [Acidithiobacillus sp. MC6.1]|nr:tryptophan synthase subunit alpha [Acidithiobacillus sp. MC6.1]
GADAVVVGSALVEQLAACATDQEAIDAACRFIEPLAQAVRTTERRGV